MQNYAYQLVFVLLSVFLVSTASAEAEADAQRSYVVNYRLDLVLRQPEAEQLNISVLIAGPDFEVSTADPRMKFAGSILRTDKNFVTLQYSLQFVTAVVTGSFKSEETEQPFQTQQQVQNGVESTAKLLFGKSTEILRVGEKSVHLTIAKL